MVCGRFLHYPSPLLFIVLVWHWTSASGRKCCIQSVVSSGSLGNAPSTFQATVGKLEMDLLQNEPRGDARASVCPVWIPQWVLGALGIWQRNNYVASARMTCKILGSVTHWLPQPRGHWQAVLTPGRPCDTMSQLYLTSALALCACKHKSLLPSAVFMASCRC